MIVTASDGTRLAARCVGRGAPVVLVHGSAGGLDSFNPIVPLLQDRYALWTYARRGYAPSDGCARPKTFADDVSDVLAVLDAAGGSGHVVGTSYGATVALHAGLAGSPMIRSVVVFEPPLFAAGVGVRPALAAYRARLEAGDLAGAARVLAGEVARVPAAMLPAITALPVSEAAGCLHDLEAMAADTTEMARWSGVRGKALLLGGGASWPPLPATMDALAEVMPGAARVTLDGQSHFATHTAPELFADALATFFG